MYKIEMGIIFMGFRNTYSRKEFFFKFIKHITGQVSLNPKIIYKKLSDEIVI